MSEMVSLKMGVKFASSLIMGEKLTQKLYIMICRNVISGHIYIKYNTSIQTKGILNRNHDYAMLR